MSHDSELKSRFEQVIQKLGGLNAAAEISQNVPQQIARWRDGKAKPPLFGAAALAKAAGVSLDWLVNGNSSPSRVDADQYELELLDVHLSAGGGYDNSHGHQAKQVIINKEFLHDCIGFESIKNLKIVFVSGDSMLPTLSDGDIAIIDISRQGNQDGIYAFWEAETGARIKRLQWTTDGVHVISDNKAYEKGFLSREAFKSGEVGISGRLIWAGKRFV